MSSTLYCYHCRTHHARGDMRLVVSRTGKRWRCLRSIKLAMASLEEREEFGHRMTVCNMEDAKEKTRRSSNPERFAGK